ncbi:MAG: DUF4177 domain-containing protein [Mangrovicoccus sp.]
MVYEYRVIPAPLKGRKERGLKSPQERYAAALTEVLNAEAEKGWEFVRAEVLPSQERKGLAGSKSVIVNVLVFRRDPNQAEDRATREALRMMERPSNAFGV